MNQVMDKIDRIAEELEEFHGWLKQPDTENEFSRRQSTWTLTDPDGTSELRVAEGARGPAYRLQFEPVVPWFVVVVRTCIETAADCTRCGTCCEGDCNVPDVTVNGEVI